MALDPHDMAQAYADALTAIAAQGGALDSCLDRVNGYLSQALADQGQDVRQVMQKVRRLLRARINAQGAEIANVRSNIDSYVVSQLVEQRIRLTDIVNRLETGPQAAQAAISRVPSGPLTDQPPAASPALPAGSGAAGAGQGGFTFVPGSGPGLGSASPASGPGTSSSHGVPGSASGRADGPGRRGFVSAPPGGHSTLRPGPASSSPGGFPIRSAARSGAPSVALPEAHGLEGIAAGGGGPFDIPVDRPDLTLSRLGEAPRGTVDRVSHSESGRAGDGIEVSRSGGGLESAPGSADVSVSSVPDGLAANGPMGGLAGSPVGAADSAVGESPDASAAAAACCPVDWHQPNALLFSGAAAPWLRRAGAYYGMPELFFAESAQAMDERLETMVNQAQAAMFPAAPKFDAAIPQQGGL